MKRFFPTLACALLVLSACRGHDTGRPRRFDAVRGEDRPPAGYVGCPPDRYAAPWASGGAGGPTAAAAPAAPAPRPKAEVPGRIPGTPSIRIVWEALAVEIERLDESKFKRPPSSSPIPQGDVDLEVILLNSSFTATPQQDHENRGEKAVGRVARVSDQDMNDLLTVLERGNFFRYARPTESVRYLFPTDRARGRITVERDGNSVTLLSMRGLGLQEATKEIPGIYASAKYAITVLKNRTPTLRVKAVDVDELNPKDKPTDSGAGSKRAPAPAK